MWRKWAGGQAGSLTYEVNIGDQLYFCHASQILQNDTGHLDLSNIQQDELLDIYPFQKHSMSQDACQPEAKIQISKSTSNAMLHFKHWRLTK